MKFHIKLCEHCRNAYDDEPMLKCEYYDKYCIEIELKNNKCKYYEQTKDFTHSCFNKKPKKVKSYQKK